MRTPADTQQFARGLRKAMSPPEVRLWVRLKRLAPHGMRFRRQHAIGPYVLDFYCPAAKLAVEVDGYGHGMGDRGERDLIRDAWMAQRGIDTLRLLAADVMRDVDEMARQVAAEAQRRLDRGP